jgi:hypothetical protein
LISSFAIENSHEEGGYKNNSNHENNQNEEIIQIFCGSQTKEESQIGQPNQ